MTIMLSNYNKNDFLGQRTLIHIEQVLTCGAMWAANAAADFRMFSSPLIQI